MPFIRLTTNKVLTLHQELLLKETLDQLFCDEDVMLHIEDNQVMYFQNEDGHCMKVDIYFRKQDLNYEMLGSQLAHVIVKSSGIPANKQLISFIKEI